jgi:Ala-tRNA(Pro) deacylase
LTSITRPYQTLVHDRTVTAHETAAASHVRQQQFAKTVMLKVDGKLAMMVMPAAYRIDLTRLSRALGGDVVELAGETEFKDAFSDCEVGAMPPFGISTGCRSTSIRAWRSSRRSRSTPARTTDAVRMPYASSRSWRSRNCCGWRM